MPVNDGIELSRTEKLPEDTQAVFTQGRQSKADVDTHIDETLSTETDPGIRQELGQLKGKTAEVEQAFETRVERMSSPYVISQELQKTLRVAKLLHKPLLLEGEPGTGKTSLAYALAGEEDMPIIHCRGKSTLTAQSVMYEIDYVARLNDASLSQAIPEVMREQASRWASHVEKGGDVNDPEFRNFMEGFERASKLLNLGKVSDISNYVTYGELGEAITRAARGEKVILLFDEIDKAKRDFPNDLLDELEHLTMRVRETGQELSASRENLTVIITSNHERDLPEPFLRRCVYSYLEFPKPDHMTEIVKAHLPDVEEGLLSSAIKRFYEVRALRGIQKEPSTSEMIDWMRVLMAEGLEEVMDTIPYPEVLAKVKEDLDLVRERLGVKSEDAQRYEANGADREAIHAKLGRFVFRMNYENTNGEPPAEVYLELANRGFNFKTHEQYNEPFEILEPGYERVGFDTFSVAPPKNLSGDALKQWIDRSTELYALLYTQGMVGSQYVKTEVSQQFTQVDKATKDFIKGKDKDGRTLYKFADGTWVFEESVQDNAGSVTTMESAMLEAMQGERNQKKN